MTRGFIFDLDGTLLDSLAEIGTAMNSALAAHGLPVHPVPEYRLMIGEGVEVLAQRAAPTLAGPERTALVNRYREFYRDQGHHLSQPYPGVRALLRHLTKLKMPMAVLSNKRDDFTRALVAHHFHDIGFLDVRGEREGVPRKPDPTAALELALALQCPPETLTFVGDTAVDMKTARAAGMRAVGVAWGFRPEELRPAGASVVIEHPEALLELS